MVEITELKEKANKRLTETEQLVQIPASIKTALQAHDEQILEHAIKERELLRESAEPILTFTFEHSNFIANRWHKIAVPVSNTGTSPAFEVTIFSSEEFDVKRVQPITITAGKTGMIEWGIIPKKDGIIPVEITLEYRDAIGTPFRETQEFWIDVVDRMSNTPEKDATTTPPQSPVSQFTPKPLTPKQIPPELSDRYTESEFIGKGGFARVFKAKRKDGHVSP